MKKNDVMGYVAYALMLGLACGIGFGVLRPYFNDSETYGTAPFNNIVFVLVAVVIGIVLNGIFVELGHILGCKAGHYDITSVNILGLNFKKQDNGKFKFSFAEFDGFTGETKYVPKDMKKSNPRHIIYMPLVFFLVEAVGLAVLIALGKSFGAQGTRSMYWWGSVWGIVILTIGAMIFIYDIFPAALDARNDGYLLTILTNQTNQEAYNQILVAEDRMAKGLPAGETPVYDSVTDFTARVNDVTLYQRLSKRDYEGALAILEKTIACKSKVSESVYQEAVAQKTAILIVSKPLQESKDFYIALPLESKKYIAALGSAAAVRCYVLVSGLIEESLNETQEALNRADSALKKSGDDKKPVETALLKEAVLKVLAAHKDWDLSDYGYSLTPAAPKTEEAKPEEKKPEETEQKNDSPADNSGK
jgi:hypothetical protein